MSAALEFYFDFTSPFGYLASERITKLSDKHGRTVTWRPIVLGFIFQVTGSKALVDSPLKGDYSLMDIERCAREHAIAFNMPSVFPIGTVAAARAVLWLQSLGTDTGHTQSIALIHALYRAYFIHGSDISQIEQVLQTAAGIGIDEQALKAALLDDKVKALLKQATKIALERKVFGSPITIVDGEPFWGSDRLDQVDRWLASGGW